MPVAIKERIKRTSYSPPPLTEDNFSELQKCMADPVYFVNTYCLIIDPVKGKMPWKMYPFQEATIRSFLDHNHCIILKSRQMGLSWTIAGYVLWLTLFFSEKNVQMVSLKETVAIRLLGRIKFLFDNLPDWMRLRCLKDTEQILQFANGSRIESIPTSDNAGRSEGLSLLFIDEAAHVNGVDGIWQAAGPTLSTGGMAIINSTPNGAAGWYYSTWQEAVTKQNGFHPIKLPWWLNPVFAKGLRKVEEYLSDGTSVTKYTSPWYEAQRKRLGYRKCAQEIDCEFVQSGANYFDTTLMAARLEFLVKKAKYKELWHNELRIFRPGDDGSHYVMGIDTATGHGNDYSAAVVRDFVTWNQVATLKTQVPVSMFAEKLMMLGEMYGFPFVVGEENGYSLASLLQLRDVQRYPEDKFYHDKKLVDRFAEPSDHVLGWNNNIKSRAFWLQAYEELIRTNPKTFKDSRVVAEILSFVIDKHGKARALDGYTDDMIFADICCLIGLQTYKPVGALPFFVK